MRLVLIKDKIVFNYFEADSNDVNNIKNSWGNGGYEVVESDTAQIGWIYENGEFTPPQISTDEVSLPKYITRLAFRNRFTAEEKVGLELAALDDPNATMQDRQKSAMLRVYLKDVDAATFIDLDRQETKDGVENLETVGLLTSGRANQILTAEIQPLERYRG